MKLNQVKSKFKFHATRFIPHPWYSSYCLLSSIRVSLRPLARLYQRPRRHMMGTSRRMRRQWSEYWHRITPTYLGTPSRVSSWNLYVIMEPIFGGLLRCLSLNPVPTLNVFVTQPKGCSELDSESCQRYTSLALHLARRHDTFQCAHDALMLPFSRNIACDLCFSIIECLWWQKASVNNTRARTNESDINHKWKVTCLNLL